MQEVLDNILLRTYRNGLIPAAGEDGCVTGTETIFNSMSNLQQQRHNAAAAAQLMFELNLAKLATAVSLQGGNVERRGDGSMEMLNTSLMPSRAISSVISTASSSTSPNGSLIRCPVSTNSNNSIDFNHSFHGSSSLEQMKSTPVYPHKFNERKRRKTIGNMDNTLDGLVAKRTDINASVKKRYQTEVEAIELPDDDIEIKRMETDPDVSTRMCSICGYQGKWVSEMVRHKRVHTSDRPFKCKYCNRTSKWKADLIRHVAKTHGIRVVSKYSRSKTFDSNPKEKAFGKRVDVVHSKKSPSTNSTIRKAHRLNVLSQCEQYSQRKSLDCLDSFSNDDGDMNNNNDSSIISEIPSVPVVTFRCIMCLFEEDSFPSLVNHISEVHNKPPFYCGGCNRTFLEVKSAMGHYEDDEKHCSQHDLKLNFTMINGTPRIESSQRPEKETFDKSSFNEFPSMVLFVNSMNGGQQQGGQSPALSVHSATDSTITLESPPISRQQSEDSNEATKEITELNNTIKPISSSNESSTIITTRQQTLNNNVLDLTLTSPTIGSGSSSSSTQLQHHNPINLTNNPIGFMNNNLAALIVQSRLAMANANLIGNSGTSTGEQTELFPFMRQSMSIPFHIAQQQIPVSAGNPIADTLYRSLFGMQNGGTGRFTGIR